MPDILITILMVFGAICYFIINFMIAGMAWWSAAEVDPNTKAWPIMLWAIPFGLPFTILLLVGLVVWGFFKPPTDITRSDDGSN